MPDTAHGLQRVEQIMGMPIIIDVRDPEIGPEVLDRAFDWFRFVDNTFSTYKADSEISQLNRTAAAQYRQTRHLSKTSARVGDLVFFYGSGGVYHVGIYAGHGYMWAAPHTGATVRKQKIYGSHWKVGRVV